MSQPKRYDCTESWGMDECMAFMDERVDGRYVEYSDYTALAAENERLTAEVEWLRKADRLVCWNPGTQEWEVRHEAPK